MLCHSVNYIRCCSSRDGLGTGVQRSLQSNRHNGNCVKYSRIKQCALLFTALQYENYPEAPRGTILKKNPEKEDLSMNCYPLIALLELGNLLISTPN